MKIENVKIVGIDPGKSGGIAYVNANDVIVAEPFGKTEGDILNQLRAVIAPKTKVYLEQVGGYAGRSLPGSAMFNFGRNYGFLIGVLMEREARVSLVTPQRWQKTLGAGTRGERTRDKWKLHLKGLAQLSFPGLSNISLSTSDALLILKYAMIQESISHHAVVQLPA